MVEGTRIELFRLDNYQKNGKWVKGSLYTSGVGMGGEPLSEALEKIFPRYQITSYRGIDLGIVKRAELFDNPRWSGLTLSARQDVAGSIYNMDKRAARFALRSPSRRYNAAYLRNEAIVIMETIFPGAECSLRARGGNIDNFNLARDELAEAFSSMGLI
jgi:hypothetical protein